MKQAWLWAAWLEVGATNGVIEPRVCDPSAGYRYIWIANGGSSLYSDSDCSTPWRVTELGFYSSSGKLPAHASEHSSHAPSTPPQNAFDDDYSTAWVGAADQQNNIAGLHANCGEVEVAGVQWVIADMGSKSDVVRIDVTQSPEGNEDPQYKHAVPFARYKCSNDMVHWTGVSTVPLNQDGSTTIYSKEAVRSIRCMLYHGMMWDTSSGYNEETAQTAEDCQDLCHDAWDCEAFRWHRSNDSCQLLVGIGGPVEDADWESGWSCKARTTQALIIRRLNDDAGCHAVNMNEEINEMGTPDIAGGLLWYSAKSDVVYSEGDTGVVGHPGSDPSSRVFSMPRGNGDWMDTVHADLESGQLYQFLNKDLNPVAAFSGRRLGLTGLDLSDTGFAYIQCLYSDFSLVPDSRFMLPKLMQMDEYAVLSGRGDFVVLHSEDDLMEYQWWVLRPSCAGPPRMDLLGASMTYPLGTFASNARGRMTGVLEYDGQQYFGVVLTNDEEQLVRRPLPGWEEGEALVEGLGGRMSGFALDPKRQTWYRLNEPSLSQPSLVWCPAHFDLVSGGTEPEAFQPGCWYRTPEGCTAAPHDEASAWKLDVHCAVDPHDAEGAWGRQGCTRFKCEKIRKEKWQQWCEVAEVETRFEEKAPVHNMAIRGDLQCPEPLTANGETCCCQPGCCWNGCFIKPPELALPAPPPGEFCLIG